MAEDLLSLHALSAAGKGLGQAWPTDALSTALQELLGLVDTRILTAALELRGHCRPCSFGMAAGLGGALDTADIREQMAEEALGKDAELRPLAGLLEASLGRFADLVPPAWPRRPFHVGEEGPAYCPKLIDGHPCGLPVRPLDFVQQQSVSVVSRARTAYAFSALVPRGPRLDLAIRAMAANELFILAVEASGMCQRCAFLAIWDVAGTPQPPTLSGASGEHRGPGTSPDKGNAT